MICLSVCLSVCLYPLNRKIDAVESRLKKQFTTFKVSSEPELKAVLKKEYIFCIVIGCNIREPEYIIKIRKICSVTPKVPCLMYGHAREQEFLFQLAKDGLDAFIPNANIELLLEKLHQLKEKATFRIDLRDFGIELNQCTNYWTKKFLKFILKDYNFLKYHTVNEIANLFSTSTKNLDVSIKKDCRLSPKQLVLCLRNYYAAYLFGTTQWSVKEIARRIGFGNEHELYKSFQNKTGLTIKKFKSKMHWRDFPTFYLENIKQNY